MVVLKKAERHSHKMYFLQRVEINNYVLINSRNFYDQVVNEAINKYDDIRKIVTRQGHDYTATCLLDYS